MWLESQVCLFFSLAASPAMFRSPTDCTAASGGKSCGIQGSGEICHPAGCLSAGTAGSLLTGPDRPCVCPADSGRLSQVVAD